MDLYDVSWSSKTPPHSKAYENYRMQKNKCFLVFYDIDGLMTIHIFGVCEGGDAPLRGYLRYAATPHAGVPPQRPQPYLQSNAYKWGLAWFQRVNSVENPRHFGGLRKG